MKDAKKNKVAGAPERPGMDWFNKGMGQFFPCDPEPPIPPKDLYSRDPSKRAMAEREYDKTVKQAQEKNGQATANTN